MCILKVLGLLLYLSTNVIITWYLSIYEICDNVWTIYIWERIKFCEIMALCRVIIVDVNNLLTYLIVFLLLRKVWSNGYADLIFMQVMCILLLRYRICLSLCQEYMIIELIDSFLKILITISSLISCFKVAFILITNF